MTFPSDAAGDATFNEAAMTDGRPFVTALYAYEPREGDELRLAPDDRIDVLACQGNWWRVGG